MFNIFLQILTGLVFVTLCAVIFYCAYSKYLDYLSKRTSYEEVKYLVKIVKHPPACIATNSIKRNLVVSQTDNGDNYEILITVSAYNIETDSAYSKYKKTIAKSNSMPNIFHEGTARHA